MYYNLFVLAFTWSYYFNSFKISAWTVNTTVYRYKKEYSIYK